MKYDPFNRGEYPVGVRTIETTKVEPRSSRKLVVEVWYPATDAYKGKDTDEATKDRFKIAPNLPELTQDAVRDAEIASVGRIPLIAYFHGGYGHRREAEHIAAHLASNGFIVAAVDFPGDSITDLSIGEENGDNDKILPEEAARARPHQASFVISDLIADSPFSSIIDADKIGSFGQSMGGFTSLRLNSIDARPGATVAIAPLFGENDLVKSMARTQTQLNVDDWEREVPTLLLTGERDSFVLLANMEKLNNKLREPKQFMILRGAGHFHWAALSEEVHELFRASFLSGSITTESDFNAKGMGEAMRPYTELVPASHGADTARSLCLAHFDANLKDDERARVFLEGDLEKTFSSRGIGLDVEKKKEMVRA